MELIIKVLWVSLTFGTIILFGLFIWKYVGVGIKNTEENQIVRARGVIPTLASLVTILMMVFDLYSMNNMMAILYFIFAFIGSLYCFRWLRLYWKYSSKNELNQ